MQLLLCSAGKERYALDSDYIFAVIPKVKLKELPHTVDYVAGLLNYGGHPVPVVDFCKLITGNPSKDFLHSRIILMAKPNNQPQNIPLLGIMAEKVTQTIEKDKTEFLESGVRIKDLPFLDGVLTDNSEIIQLVLIEELMKFLHDALQIHKSILPA